MAPDLVWQFKKSLDMCYILIVPPFQSSPVNTSVRWNNYLFYFTPLEAFLRTCEGTIFLPSFSYFLTDDGNHIHLSIFRISLFDAIISRSNGFETRKAIRLKIRTREEGESPFSSWIEGDLWLLCK